MKKSERERNSLHVEAGGQAAGEGEIWHFCWRDILGK